MSKVEEFYRALVKDPDLEIKTGQSREQAARQEAEYRARQYNNNAEALSLATQPPESAINSLLDHVQVNKSYKDTALLKFSNLKDRVNSLLGRGKDSEPDKHFITKFQDVVMAAEKDAEKDNTDRDAEYHSQYEKLNQSVKDEMTTLRTGNDRLKEILEDPEYKAYSQMQARLIALATDNGKKSSYTSEELNEAIKKLTPEEKKIKKKADNWKDPLKPSFLDKFEWGKDLISENRSRANEFKTKGPRQLVSEFDSRLKIQKNILDNVASLRHRLAKAGPIKRHQKTLEAAEAKKIEAVQNDKSVAEADEKVMNDFNEAINESATEKVDNSIKDNKSKKPNEEDSKPTESEKLEAQEQRIQDLKNHRDELESALSNHEANKPAKMGGEDTGEVDEDGFPIVTDEESDDAYEARPDVKAWKTRMDDLESIFNETSKRLDNEQKGNDTPGVDDSLQLDKPTPQEAGAEAGIEVADFGNQVLDNYDGGSEKLQEDINAAKGLYRDDNKQFTVEGDPSGPFYNKEENRPMNRAEVGTVLGEDVEPDKESGGKLGRGDIQASTLKAITEEYEKRFGEPFPLDSEGRKLSKKSETYQALARAGVFYHDNKPIKDKDGNDVPVGEGTEFHKQQSKFNKDRFVPNKKDPTVTNDKTNASIDDIYDQIKMVAENPEMFTKTMSKDEIDQTALQALNDYKENPTPENKSKLQAILTRRNIDTGVETNINQTIERIDQENQKTTSESEQTEDGKTPEQSSSKPRPTPHYTVKRHLGDQYQELLDNGKLHNEDGTAKSIKQVKQDFPKEEEPVVEDTTSVESEGTTAMDDIKAYMSEQGYKKKDIDGMEEAGLFHFGDDTSEPPLRPENIEEMHNKGEFNKYFEDNQITPQGKAAEVKPKAKPKTGKKAKTKPENKPVPDDVKAYMTAQGHDEAQINEMEEKGLFHPDGDRTSTPHTLEDITERYDNQDTFNEYKEQTAGSDTESEADPQVDPTVQEQLDKADEADLIQHAYEKEFGLEEGEEDDFYKLEDYKKDFMEEHSKKSLSQVNKKLAQINKSKREFTAKQEQAKTAEPKQSPEEKAEAKQKQQAADTSPVPHNELMKTDKSQKTAEMHAIAIQNHLEKHGDTMSPKSRANLEHAQSENNKQLHPATRSHMKREMKRLGDKYADDDHVKDLMQQNEKDQHETHMAHSEDPAHQSHRDEIGSKSKANEYITSVEPRTEPKPDSQTPWKDKPGTSENPYVYGHHTVDSDNEGKIDKKTHPLTTATRSSSKLKEATKHLDGEKAYAARRKLEGRLVHQDGMEDGQGPPDPEVARRKIAEGYVWHEETRHWILKETLEEEHGGMSGFSGSMMNGHAKNAAGKNIFENEHGEAGSGVFHLSGGNTHKLGQGLAGKALQNHYTKNGQLAAHTASGNNSTKINNTKEGMTKAGLGSKLPKAPTPQGFMEGLKSGYQGDKGSFGGGASPYTARFKSDFSSAKSALSSFTSRFGGGGGGDVEKSYLASPEVLHQSRVDLLKRLDKVV